MFYDLNVPWTTKHSELQRTIAFLSELGYDVLALSHSLSGKLPADISCPIPSVLPFSTPPKLRILRRCTLILSDPSQNHRIATLASNYDLLAIRPTDEKTLQQACTSLDCDIISIDLTQRLSYWFKFKTLSAAIERGIKLEICYAPGMLATESSARRNLISNATQLIRATRGRGLIISSEARSALACRAPWDVVNLAAVLGLGQEKGKEAVDNEARSVVVSAQLKSTGYRGVIDIIYGGEHPAVTDPEEKSALSGTETKKRKAGAGDGDTKDNVDQTPKPTSKREQKRLAKKARMGETAQSTKTQPG